MRGHDSTCRIGLVLPPFYLMPTLPARDSFPFPSLPLTTFIPTPLQALPIIMSGRDCIGIAKTGSGKTLAFVLPLLRHVKDQPPLAQGDGPIGLIMAPTRELVQQIAKVRVRGRAGCGEGRVRVESL